MIIISPFAKRIRESERTHDLKGTPHPKNYPFWKELIPLIIETYHEPLIQVGVEDEEQLLPDFRKNLPLKELEKLVLSCRTWIGIDSFFQHFCWDLGKRGIVLWGQSDPVIFGHPENINLLKSRKYLREHQFFMWEQTKFDENHFVKLDVVINALKEFFPEQNPQMDFFK